MYFFIRNSLYSIPQGFTLEQHERRATMATQQSAIYHMKSFS